MKRLIFSILLLLSFSGYTQQFSRLTSSNGLSQNWVRCMYQDDVGYMWIGTASGLDRFNGYEFKAYNIGNDNVNAIVKYSQNELLICTDLGILVFNLETEKISQFQYIQGLSVLCVAKQDDQYIWFGSNIGLYRFNKKTNKTDKYQLSNNYINTIQIDSKSNVIVGTKNGLFLFDSKSNTFKEVKAFSGIDVLTISNDNKNRLWIGSARHGLDLMEDINSLNVKQIIEGNIINLLVDNKNFLWIARGSAEGLQKLNLNTFTTNKYPEIIIYKNKPLDNKSLSDNSVFCIYQDKQNDIWIGTFGGGLNYLSYREKQFSRINFVQDNTISSNLVNCIYEEKDYRWIGTEMGLLRYDKRNNSYFRFENNPKNNKSILGNAIYAIKKDSRGNLWVGTWSGGLNLYDYKTQTFRQYFPNGNANSLSCNNIFAISEDSNQNLWIGTIGGGLNKFDYKTQTFTSYKENGDNKSIWKNYINDIIQLKDGTMLISDYNAISFLDFKKNIFKRIELSKSKKPLIKLFTICLFQDSKGHIWVGTSNGLKCLSEDGKKFKSYSIEHGIIDNTINAITEDNHNNLWLSTNKGISKFIGGVNLPEIPTFINFTSEDGIASNECKPRSIFKDTNGIIYIGSSNGLTMFNPDSIKLNYTLPQIAFTDLLVLNTHPNKNVSYNSISENVNTGKTVNIDYRSSNFTIKFAALNFFNTNKNKYKYCLEGYDSTWIDAGNQRSITYTNIQPGNYTFKVIASNNDGIWNLTPKTLQIEILPPWWRTIYFKITIAFIVILILFLFFKIRITNVKRQQKVLEQTVQSRTKALNAMNSILRENQQEIKKQNIELFEHRNNLEQLVNNRTSELEIAMKKAEENDKLKTAFLQNISHEIRTPMNAIIGFSALLKQQDLPKEERNQFVDIINGSCNQLLSIINDIINIATIESGQAKVNESRVNINSVVKIFYEQFKLKTLSKNVELSYKTTLDDKEAYFQIDETKFIEIFSNLINNAIKFTENGTVEYGYEVRGSFLQFYVKDSGIGIASEQHDKIFERFRQAGSTIASKFGGTGLGLSISKAYVELLGGHIWLKSEEDKGSEFYFTIPIKRLVSKNNSQTLSQHIEKAENKTAYRAHILVVEDEEFNFRYLQKILSILHFSVERASNGLEAVEKCKINKDIKLILMDIKMPEMDGYEAVRLIRTFNPTIPIIAQTAYALAKDKEKIMESGFDDYITKPIDKNLLVDCIEKYFD